MEDGKIVELYWLREESAIAKTDEKYGNYCRSIAMNILQNPEDTEESVSDTYLAAWNTIPPHRPAILATFLGKLTRRISIDRWRQNHALKRGGNEVKVALEELEECVSERQTAEDAVIDKEMIESVNDFLKHLPKAQRQMFLLRYWYLEPIERIARQFGLTANHTRVLLHRIRQRLRTHLAKEGYL